MASLRQVRGIYRIKPIAPNVCTLWCINQGNAGGSIPAVLLNPSIKTSLALVPFLQTKFSRNPTLVDAEVRASFRAPPPLSSLLPDQSEIVMKCRMLMFNDGSTYNSLPSPSPFVQISRKNTKPHKTNACSGKATVTVDVSPNQALAYLFSYCSESMLRRSREANNPARLILRAKTPHDHISATIKKYPFPLANREFVCRRVAASEGDSFIIAVDSIDVPADYGEHEYIERGTMSCFYLITPTSEPNCSKVSLHVSLNPGKWLPSRTVTEELAKVFSVLETMRSEVQRGDEIDLAKLTELEHIMANVEQDYEKKEDEMLERVCAELGEVNEEDYREIGDSSERSGVMDSAADSGFRDVFGSSLTPSARATNGDIKKGKMSFCVDASVERCAAYEVLEVRRASAEREQSEAEGAKRSAWFVSRLRTPGPKRPAQIDPRRHRTRTATALPVAKILVVFHSLRAARQHLPRSRCYPTAPPSCSHVHIPDTLILSSSRAGSGFATEATSSASRESLRVKTTIRTFTTWSATLTFPATSLGSS